MRSAAAQGVAKATLEQQCAHVMPACCSSQGGHMPGSSVAFTEQCIPMPSFFMDMPACCTPTHIAGAVPHQ